jgi:hypothetical protein
MRADAPAEEWLPEGDAASGNGTGEGEIVEGAVLQEMNVASTIVDGESSVETDRQSDAAPAPKRPTRSRRGRVKADAEAQPAGAAADPKPEPRASRKSSEGGTSPRARKTSAAKPRPSRAKVRKET